MVEGFRKLKKELRAHANKERALLCMRYFKTGKGEYGYGDVFLGLTVPMLRKIAKKYADLSLPDIEKLLKSKIHEERFIALVILVMKYTKIETKIETKTKIADFYLKHRKFVNSWDLVDTSAPQILGAYLFGKDTRVLYRLARSKSIWDRRIAIIATQYFIRLGEYKETLAIAELLLSDTHDLIHKAVGWMLREVGNRSRDAEQAFLKKNVRRMPRTMLRYAIEKFPESKRRKYLTER